MPRNRAYPHAIKPVGTQLLVYLVLVMVLFAGGVIWLRWWTHYRYSQRIYTVDSAPARRVAVVFGAAILPDGTVSAVLADRVRTGAELYHAGRVDKLLMTGDNRFVDYNEPEGMRRYALELGVPDQDIILDYAGRRTYDSCYRAKYIFGVTDAILVTQAYHLDRALMIADGLGIDAIGVKADLRRYPRMPQWRWRELLATPLAWLDVYLLRPEPILGERLPIFEADSTTSFLLPIPDRT